MQETAKIAKRLIGLCRDAEVLPLAELLPKEWLEDNFAVINCQLTPLIEDTHGFPYILRNPKRIEILVDGIKVELRSIALMKDRL